MYALGQSAALVIDRSAAAAPTAAAAAPTAAAFSDEDSLAPKIDHEAATDFDEDPSSASRRQE